MKQAIINIIENYGTVSVPYKSEIMCHYGKAEITKLEDTYLILPYWKKFLTPKDAVNYFLDLAYTSKNKGYIQSRLQNKGLLKDDIEYMDTDKLEQLFIDEALIVDEEAKLLEIESVTLPTPESALAELDTIIPEINQNNIVELISNFRNKYISLDPYINLSYLFQGEESEYTASINFKQYDKDKIIKPNKGYVYKNMRLCVKIKDYNFYDLKF